MNPTELTTFFTFIRQQKVLVLGDIMLDRYVWGNVERISPEAPVPVLHFGHADSRLGGAGNVAKNIQALGATPVLCSVISDDHRGRQLISLLQENGMTPSGIYTRSTGITTVKTRIIGQNQHLLRIDEEDIRPLDQAEENAFLDIIRQQIELYAPSLIIFQDYNKGSLTARIIDVVLDIAKKENIRIAVDPKEDHFFSFHKADIFKPNLKEIHNAVPFRVEAEIASLKRASDFLRKEMGCTLICITLSDKGIYLDDGKVRIICPTNPRNIVDVCGAGDAVVSIVTLARLAGLGLQTIGRMANLAGGLVCEEVGVVPVDRARLENELHTG